MLWDDYAQQYRQLDHLEPGVPPLLRSALAGPRGRFLDVGCGEGFLLDRVRRERPEWTVTGFEISPYRAEIAAARGHDVLVDPDGRVPSEPGSWDVVASCHVIEHVPDDFEYARYLASLVRPGGHLYVETPVKLRGAWYFRRNPQAGWVLDPTHVREYRSADAANAPLIAADLHIAEQQETPVRLSLASAEVLVRRLLRRPAGPPGRLEGWRAMHVSVPRYRVHCALTRKR